MKKINQIMKPPFWKKTYKKPSFFFIYIIHFLIAGKIMISDTYKQSNETNLKRIFNKIPHNHPTIKTTREGDSKCPFFLQQEAMILDEQQQQHLSSLEPSQHQIDLVRTSWVRVSEIRHEADDRNISSSHAFGIAFYEALFEMNIECKHLLTNSFQQARALTGMISLLTRAPHITSPTTNTSPTTIRDINAKKRSQAEVDECDPEWLTLQMKKIGAKHYFYKVKPHHFELVGPAFVKALQKRLGDEYTDEIGEAWVKVH